ncbi:MAG TPA: hypothetical protein PLL88_05005 [Anaerolineaceae bacterium]|jgi:hypothetical protein|nr:hypothetical protein [Anaerolineaceae bacterium]
MKLSAPTKLVFWLATILAVLGIIGNFVALPVIGGFTFWLLAAGFVLLWLGNVLKGF